MANIEMNVLKVGNSEFEIADAQARQDCSNLKDDLNDAIKDFAVPTQEAVDNWLNNHPEATTTVQDGSLTEAKFSDALKLKAIKDYVTPEMFGAKGDGATDDTESFNQALATGKPVFLGAKTYRLVSAIDNPSRIYLFGSGRGPNKTVINCEDSFLKNEIIGSVIRDMRIMPPFDNNLIAFPSAVNSSVITDCFMQYWYVIFNSVRGVSVIENNHFQFIRSFFCKSIIDSIIKGNYINAPMVNNPQTICFYGTVAHSVISNNFIDYMYKVFEVEYMNGVTVTGNVFDVCYTIIYRYASSMTFTGNLISNLKKMSDWDVSGNEDMDTKPWAVIRREHSSAQLSNCVFAGNTFYNDRFDAYMVCTANSYPTRFVTIDDDVPADKITFRAYKSQNAHDMEKVMIRPMLKRTVEALPSASLTGAVVSFPFDEVIYNGNLYININGSWVQMTNASS